MAALTTTTLAAALTSGGQAVSLASATGVTAPGTLTPASLFYVDTELLAPVIPSPVQGTTTSFTVERGAQGTTAQAHASGATVYIGRPDQFYTDDPVGEVPTDPVTTPWINVINGTIWTVSGTAWVVSNAGVAAAGARVQATPADPTGTTSLTEVMAGLAVAFTPTTTGNVTITVSGNVSSSGIADGGDLQISYGTGTAPGNGDVVTGTQVGNVVSYVAATVAQVSPFSVQAYVTGLTVNTAYWCDLAFEAATAGTFSITNVGVTIVEA